MQQLSPQDAMFAYMESPNTPLQLGWLNIYDPSTAGDGTIRFKDILAHVERRLHTVRFFREKLVFVPGNLDEPYWIDDEAFDLEYHVRHAALPAPGDWRQLCILAARLFARPFDFNKPLWEFFVIEGLDNVEGFPKGSFAVLAKMHHAAIDGISGVDVTTSLHTAEPDLPAEEVPEWTPEPAPRPAGLLLRAYVNRMTRPGRTLGIVARNVPVLRNVKAAIDSGELHPAERRKVPATRFSGPVGPHRVIEARRFTI
jgi:diacylglycerol O-acyltransferase / wax synthase